MMNRFSVSEDVAKRLPNMHVVVVTSYNLKNVGTNDRVAEFAEGATKTTLSNLSAYPNAQSHPRIALYRDTLKDKCNISVKKFPQSNESLYKRLLKEQKPLKSINPIVDFYNAVSIKYGVTAGAFDLGELQTRSIQPLELRMSSVGDMFRALDAEESADPIAVGTGELVYVQDKTVLTRQLAWRQSREGLVTEKTENVLFMSEVIGDAKDAEATNLPQEVAQELIRGLQQFFGVEGQISILGMTEGKLSTEVHNAFF